MRDALSPLVALACDVEERKVYSPARPWDVRRSQADVGHAARVLRFRPTVTLNEGIRRTVASFREELMLAALGRI